MTAAPTLATDLARPTNGSRIGEPVWDIALRYPPQGYWSEAEYLELGGNWMVEFSEGLLEFLPLPTPRHGRLSRFLTKLLEEAVAALGLGEVFVAPTPVRLRSGKYREPDIFVCRADRVTNPDEPPNGADLAVEIVSEGEQNRQRDLVTKRQEYAAAGVEEYWIIDPDQERITVLARDGSQYRLHGEFAAGQQATSAMLQNFSVDVRALFAAGAGPTPAAKPGTAPRGRRKRKS